MTAKEQLHERIDRLTEDEAEETLRFLENRADPFTRALRSAPLDDEPVTTEEEAAIAEADADIAAGRLVSFHEILAESGD